VNQTVEPLGFTSKEPRGYTPKITETLSEEALVEALVSVLEANYHHLHPFNVRMHEGELSKAQIRGWIANRFYYQENIPIKDAYLLAKIPARFRREWLTRIVTHDGTSEGVAGRADGPQPPPPRRAVCGRRLRQLVPGQGLV